MIKVVQYGQTLLDIAIQLFGSAASLCELAAANGLPISADVQPGQSIIIPDTMPENAIPVFADYIKSSGKVVVSGEAPTAIELIITNNGEILEGLTA